MRQITRDSGLRYEMTQPLLWSGASPYHIAHVNFLGLPEWQAELKWEIWQNRRNVPYGRGGRRLFWKLSATGIKYTQYQAKKREG